MKELYSHENWREKYGGRILLIRSYCAIKLGDPKLGMAFVGAFRKRIEEKGQQDEVPETYQKWMIEIEETF